MTVKLDAGLGTEGDYLKDIDRTARAAEDFGFAGLWTSETKHDAFLPLLLSLAIGTPWIAFAQASAVAGAALILPMAARLKA